MNEWSEEAWHRIDELLDQALDRPPAERSAFLDAACAGEPDVRAHVEALIAAEEKAPDFLDRDAAALLTTPLDASASGAGHAGRRVGPYRLIEEIGRGGMSRVYRAERVDGAFEQEVAVKLLPLGLDTPAARQRFRLEQQVLADLQHPHIARLLDGGVTDDDVPYLVMERVDGQPITAYCDAHRLPIRERLKLLAAVGKALQYAHRNLVVHRDLKPDNIFVTEDGTVQLLDFGIAKLMDAGAVSFTAPATQAGVRPMTPAYAAPEQVRGAAISAATDVYQLGVLAYELLTGHRPFASAAGSRFEMERAVLEEPPTVPSTAVTRAAARTEGPASMASTPEQVSGARDTSAERLQRALQGDLDAVVLQALAKDPGARYASAEAFVADVERYLDDRPVEARSLTTGYRMRKFIQRHQSAVAAAAAFVMLCVGFVATLAWQQQQTAQQRDRAQRQAATAEQVAAFLVDLFEASDPENTLGDTVTAQELLRRGGRRVRALSEEPDVQAQLLDAMGRAHVGLGHYATADSLLQRALSVQRQQVAPHHPEVASILSDIGLVRRERGDFAASDSLLQRALAIQINQRGRLHPEVAETLNEIGLLRQRQSDYPAAADYHRRALAIRLAVYHEQQPEVAYSLNNLALALRAQGAYAAAEALFRDAVAINREHLGPQHPETTQALNNLAWALQDQREYATADSIYREVLAINRAVLGREHPRVALDLNNLGASAARQGDLARAEPLFREALGIRRQVFGSAHPGVATSLNNLGYVLEHQGQLDEAAVQYREAVRVAQQQFGDQHVRTALFKKNLASVQSEQGQRAAAAALFREALQTLEQRLPAKHRRIGDVAYELGRVLYRQDQLTEGCALLQRAVAIRQPGAGDAPALLAEAQEWHGACLAAQGRFERAEEAFRASHAAFREAGAQQPAQQVLQRLADLYRQWDRAGGVPDSIRQRLAEPGASAS